jgi:hypothetical protein
LPLERRRFRIQIFDARDRTALAAIEEAWNQLIADNTHLTSLFQSPQYLRYRLLREPDADIRVAVVWEWSQRVVGVVPMTVSAVPLKFALGGHVLTALPFRSVHLLGGHLVVPQELPLYARLFSQVFQAIPDCEAIRLDYVRPETELWRFLTRPGSLLRRQWRVYFPEGARELNTVWLNGDFEQYLRRFSPPVRDGLERLRQRLREHRGDLALERFDGVDSVGEYLRRAGQVAKHGRQHRENGPGAASGIEDDPSAQLARDGLFRSYILRCGQDDVACCTGWQHQGVFHCIKPAVDHRVSALSPDVAMLYSIIEDLCRYRPATCVNLFAADGAARDLFATHGGFDASVMIVHRTVANFSRLALHRLLRTTVRMANDCVARPRAREWWEATITRERASQ